MPSLPRWQAFGSTSSRRLLCGPPGPPRDDEPVLPRIAPLAGCGRLASVASGGGVDGAADCRHYRWRQPRRRRRLSGRVLKECSTEFVSGCYPCHRNVRGKADAGAFAACASQLTAGIGQLMNHRCVAGCSLTPAMQAPNSGPKACGAICPGAGRSILRGWRAARTP